MSKIDKPKLTPEPINTDPHRLLWIVVAGTLGACLVLYVILYLFVLYLRYYG